MIGCNQSWTGILGGMRFPPLPLKVRLVPDSTVLPVNEKPAPGLQPWSGSSGLRLLKEILVLRCNRERGQFAPILTVWQGESSRGKDAVAVQRVTVNRQINRMICEIRLEVVANSANLHSCKTQSTPSNPSSTKTSKPPPSSSLWIVDSPTKQPARWCRKSKTEPPGINRGFGLRAEPYPITQNEISIDPKTRIIPISKESRIPAKRQNPVEP